jgi:hypothetical protein
MLNTFLQNEFGDRQMGFRVSARTVLELGSELISSDIIAFYELIKNAFDAKSRSGAEIHFHIVLRRNDYLRIRDEAVFAVPMYGAAEGVRFGVKKYRGRKGKKK